MTDKGGPGKKVTNQLFTASVTGGTLEDFSQNVILCPAQPQPPAVPFMFASGPGQNVPEVPSENQLSNLKLSDEASPGNYATSSNSEQPAIFPIANKNNIDFPVYSPHANLPTPPVSLQESKNLYRRTDVKKVSYARVPGLLSAPAPPETFNQTAIASAWTTTANPEPTPINFFQPTSSQNLPPLSSFPPVPETSAATSPVMASIPTTEAAQLTSGANFSTSGSQNQLHLGAANTYRGVYQHWFHKKIVEGRTLWQPFSMVDSLALEEAFISANTSPTTTVATDGGRYDVNILRRERFSVYWTAPPTEVRRCSWFYKAATEGRFIPYEENIATMLEEEYKTAFETNEWHRKVELPNGNTVVFHGPDVLAFFPPVQAAADAWGNTPQTVSRPQIVKRGLDEFDIDEGEPAAVDHLLFMVHGIGAVCDLKFRTVEEVVDEFRSIALQLVRSHYKASCEKGIANRIEILPISWHAKLHSEDTGIDKNLKNITLQSIPRLRDFTNDTLLDILFYTSPMYCQTIISTVGTELNRIYDLFKQRNPTFSGNVSVSGHSLGSLIVFDLLSHQHPEVEKESTFTTADDEDIVTPLKKPHPKDRRLKRRISYMMSEAGTGQPQLHYPHLSFQPVAFFALGAPIGMFVTVRGLEQLGRDFALPTCPGFFNIFHPYDPVAYRIESLINPDLANLKPVLIPHHKGRKRMHLELRETMARVSADLKQKLIDSMKNTWNAFFQVTLFGRQEQGPPSLEAEVDKVLQEQLEEEEAKQETMSDHNTEDQTTNLGLGILNKGRRIDYVLQEAPLESFNEYLFALTSHVCYWESEDTILLILREIYNTLGVTVDTQVPQPTMTVERRSFPKPPEATSLQSPIAGMDPTTPISANVNIGPPPVSGFVRKL